VFKNAVGGLLREMKSNKDSGDKPQCIYTIPYKYCRKYIGEKKKTARY
jgi:hypothetical protein